MTQFSLMKKLYLGVVISAFVWAHSQAATLTVTNINDSGPGSLRQAIVTANASVVSDTIQFNIPGPGVHTITPVTQLPDITRPLIIDGYTQPGSSPNTLAEGSDAMLLIEIRGGGQGINGLVFSGSGTNCVVRGLVVNGFNSTASILFGYNSVTISSNVVEGCFIGTDPTGMIARGPNSDGVWAFRGVGNRIGGLTPGARNIISAGQAGVRVVVNSSSNVIQGNLIGTDRTGTNALANLSGGIRVESGSDGTLIGGTNVAARNVIAQGISISTSSGHVIQGNFIGLDVTGRKLLMPAPTGLHVSSSACLIGGLTAVPGTPPGNVIAGSLVGNLSLSATVNDPAPSGNIIRGNLIGTDVTGTVNLGNPGVGISLDNGFNNLIGGTNAGAGNVISGCAQNGIAFSGGATNSVQGNRIGTDITGTLPIPNGIRGINLLSRDNLIGPGNVIAFNGGDGITCDVSSAINNRITANSIFANGSASSHLAIDLGFEGVEANDPGDTDTGPNHRQNFPVITDVSFASGNVTLSGTLNSIANSAYRLEFFGNPSCDSSGHGEGQTFLGFTTVTTDASGNAAFSGTLANTAGHSVFTATATDTNGNTSEFSACASVAGPCTIACPSNMIVSAAPNQCGANATFLPTTSGNCGGVTCSPPSGSLFPVGTNTVTCTTTSGANCSFTVVVNDTSPPNLVCPGNIVSNVPPGQASTAVNYSSPLVADNCGVLSTNCSPASGSTFLLGATTVTCAAIDTANNANTCTFTVTVTTTNAPPIARCRNVVTNADTSCQANVSAAAVDDGSSDSDGTIVSRTLAPAGPYPKGTNQVTLTVIDDRGGSNSCTATIVVLDTTAPALSCPASIVTNAPHGQSSVVVDYPLPSSNDNCPGVVTLNCTPARGSAFPLGTTVVICLVNDISGNTNTCSFNVTANPTALTVTWDGGGANSFWTNAVNWVANTLPVNGDGLVFPTNAAHPVNTNTFSGPTNLAFMELNGSNYVIFSPPITLFNGLTNIPPFLGSNTLRAAVNLAGDQTWRLGPVAEKTILTLMSNLSLSRFHLTLDADGVMEALGNVQGSAGSRLLKVGAGQLRIFGGNNFVPDVRVTGGTLLVDGTLAGGLSISNGATLRGSGAVPPFECAGEVRPDGVLTVLPGTANFISGSTLFIDLMTAAPPGAGYDQLRVSTPPNVASARLRVVGFFRPLVGETFVIMTNTGASPFTTTFIDKPEGSTFLVNNTRVAISYTGGNGNDVTITVDGHENSGLTSVWSGASTNGLWQNRFNWVGNVAPGQGDNLVFPPGVPASGLANTNDFPSGVVFNSITIAAPGYALRGNTVRVNNGIHGAYATSSSLVVLPIILTQAQTFTNGAGQLNLLGPDVDNGGYALTVQVDGGTVLFGGDQLMRGAGGLIKEGPGVLRLAATANSIYFGTTRVNEGVLELAKPGGTIAVPGDLIIGDGVGGPGSDIVRLMGQNQIANGGTVGIASSGLLDTAGHAETIGTLSGSGAIIVGNAFVSEVAGVSTFTGTISGSVGSFVKSGSGILIFAGTNTHTGTMQCQQGILQADGVQLAPLTRITSGGRLQGTGLIGALDINGNGAAVAPGSSPGILTCSNYNADGIGSGTLEIELSGPAPGSGYDQLNVRGTVTLSNQTLSVSLNFPSALGNQFVIINNDGNDAVTGVFTGRPEGSTFAAGGEQFRIGYAGGDGNDVVLTQISGIPTTAPRLDIELVSSNAVRLLWPTNPPGFNLEGNTNLVNTNGWLSVVPPFIAGTNNVVTNATSEPQKFYRLKKN